MKTFIRISSICLILVLAMTGCGKNDSAGKPVLSQPAGVSEVLQQGMAEADGKKAADAGQSAENSAPDGQRDPDGAAASDPITAAAADPAQKPASGQEESAAGIDVDLTVLSSTMVYSEVYNMMSAPEQYIGKTVKMNGPFAYFHDEATGSYYFACIIRDATACCAQGIEFVLAGEHQFPDDYPEAGEEICVSGVFDTYQEGEYTYCTLRNAKIL